MAAAITIAGFVFLCAPLSLSAATDPADYQFFESKVRPILVAHCGKCHGDRKQEAGLQLTTRAGAFKGGESGPALVPGDAKQSRLLQAVRRSGELKMPPKDADKLTAGQVEILAQWISKGAPWPEEASSSAGASATNHWAFEPVKRMEPPEVKNKRWPRGAIDRFVLARLEEKRLTPSRDADKQTLLRRLAFDLTGLPPTAEEMAAFQRDRSPEAIEHAVDRLLASRQFGERWGRHWLDVARYADSNGSDENFTYYDAWRFRNYVIEAFHKDKPFDQFVREQLAGDLLPSSGQAQRDEQITATGFLVLGPKVIGDDDKEQLRMDVVDEQIDTVGKAFLGLTLGCARCHDHKFDLVPTRDYYAMAGIFSSTETVHGQLLHRRDLSGWKLRPLGPDGDKMYRAWLAYDEKLDALKKKKDESQTKLTGLKKKAEATTASEEITELEAALKSLGAEIKQLSTNAPPKPPLAMAVGEREPIGDTAIRVRGEVHRHGQTVPRGFVQAASHGARFHPPVKQSGRLELAEWLVEPGNPLTARVAVNRIWHHLFGAGLVRTVDDFGRQGERPSHPELLDYLASRFVELNWSFKGMIREIVLSRAYQMNSEDREKAFRADPENRLLWRMNRRRLDIEALRDSVLAISGQLDPSPAESVVSHLPDQATGVGDKPHKPLASVRRSVYLPVVRNDLRPEFQAFDFADPQMVSGRRNQTIVAPQSLFLMNGQLLRDAARLLAEKLAKQTGAGDEKELVRAAYSVILGRSSSADELRSALEYVAESSRDVTADGANEKSRTAALANLCHAMMCSSQFLYVD